METYKKTLKKQVIVDLAERALPSSLSCPLLFTIYVAFTSVKNDYAALTYIPGGIFLFIALVRFTLSKKVDYFTNHSKLNGYVTFNILTLCADFAWSLSGTKNEWARGDNKNKSYGKK